MPQTVAALYQFVPLPDAATLAPALERVCRNLDLTGTLLLAHEGINGTVAGSAEAIDVFLAALNGPALFGGRLDRLECKLSTAEAPPFARMKVKLKPEIVTFDGGATDPSQGVGARVAPEDWNALLDRPGVVAIDTRNRFEVALGTFDGAVDPGLTRFGDFRDFAERLDPGTEVALFCTGGIRCEKAGAYLAARGFENVHLLQGGILKYLETVPEAESRWTGDCFVFDGRIALGPALAERPDHLPEGPTMTDSATRTSARIDHLEMRLTEQDATIDDLNRTVTEQWRLIDRLRRRVESLTERVEEAGARVATGGTEPPPPHY